MKKVSPMIMLIDRYSNFINDIGGKAEDLLDDLALNNEALTEFQSSYNQEQIDEYNKQLKLKEWFAEEEEEERKAARDGGLDSSILGDNFWNE